MLDIMRATGARLLFTYRVSLPWLNWPGYLSSRILLPIVVSLAAYSISGRGSGGGDIRRAVLLGLTSAAVLGGVVAARQARECRWLERLLACGAFGRFTWHLVVVFVIDGAVSASACFCLIMLIEGVPLADLPSALVLLPQAAIAVGGLTAATFALALRVREPFSLTIPVFYVAAATTGIVSDPAAGWLAFVPFPNTFGVFHYADGIKTVLWVALGAWGFVLAKRWVARRGVVAPG